MNDIARMVIKEVGSGTIAHFPMRGGEPERSIVVGDPGTLKSLYNGVTPELISLEDGIKETVKWYLEHPDAS